jgi:hypothetical protein
MTHLYLTYPPSASRQDEALENCVCFDSEDHAPPPTAPCMREVSWGSQSVSALLIGDGGGGTGYGTAAPTPSSEIHIFMDTMDLDLLWYPSQTNFSGMLPSELVRMRHRRTHPTTGRSESRRSLRHDGEGPPPPLSLTSSTSIEILHTGRSSRSIVSDLLWEDSFTVNGTATDDPLACYRDRYRTPRSTTTAPLVDSMVTKPSPKLGSSESSRSDEDSDGTASLRGEPQEGSSCSTRRRDVAPRMPSRRRRLSEDGT